MTYKRKQYSLFEISEKFVKNIAFYFCKTVI